MNKFNGYGADKTKDALNTMLEVMKMRPVGWKTLGKIVSSAIGGKTLLGGRDDDVPRPIN
jgi:hypothetical protein